ncbi:MAG: hypothetical protein ABL962_11905 [Fimbriimonadaceae bacterium]
MNNNLSTPRTSIRVALWLIAIVLSFVLTAVVATERARANGDSNVGVGDLIAYALVWPGIGTFFLILADGIYLDRHFSTKLIARSTAGAILPVLVNFGFAISVSVLPNPFNQYAALTAIPVAVLFPIGICALAITDRWPFSISTKNAHAK